MSRTVKPSTSSEEFPPTQKKKRGRQNDDSDEDIQKTSKPTEDCIEGICGVCEEKFENYTCLFKHMEKRHNVNSLFTCKQCRRYYLVDDKTTRERRSEVCRTCTEGRALQNYFSRDMKCNSCKSVYPRQADLAKHMWLHMKVQPFVCGICPDEAKNYSTYNNFEGHMQRCHIDTYRNRNQK